MTCAMLVNAPLCMSGPFNWPVGPTRSRRVGEVTTVRSLPPPIAAMTPLFPEEVLANDGPPWQRKQFAPPVDDGVLKSCFPRFSLSVKFGKGWIGSVTAAPASYFESND